MDDWRAGARDRLKGMRPACPILLGLAVAAAGFSMAACGAGEATRDTARDSSVRVTAWEAVPASPLSPREGALALWTGREVVVAGGSDAPPCPPTADCVPPDVPPLADGAAFDPQERTWRRIADSPVPFDAAQGIVIGATAYVWVAGTPGRPKAERAFLAYQFDENRWRELPLPARDAELHGIVRAGERIVAYMGSDERGERPDMAFDPATSSWSRLPPDPLSPSFDRSMAWSGRELVLFDHELVPNPGSEEPALTRAAALDLETGSWRRLPDSEILASGPWVSDGARLINPTLGGADGGETSNWGRTYPYGGILDVRRGEWLELPDPPSGQEAGAAGVLTESGAHYFGASGWVFDAFASEWIELPPIEAERAVTGRAVGAAGHDLFVFGGARWNADGLDATLLADASTWSPPAGSSSAPSSTKSSPASSENSVSVASAGPEASLRRMRSSSFPRGIEPLRASAARTWFVRRPNRRTAAAGLEPATSGVTGAPGVISTVSMTAQRGLRWAPGTRLRRCRHVVGTAAGAPARVQDAKRSA